MRYSKVFNTAIIFKEMKVASSGIFSKGFMHSDFSLFEIQY